MARRLTEGELRLARQVFGDAIRLERVRVFAGGFGRFAVTVGANLFMPDALRRDDFAAAPVSAQALFVHELVHVWQFQTRPGRTLASWAKAVATGGYGPGLPAYRYTLPLGRFDALGLERQASVVEHAFLLARGWRPSALGPEVGLDDLAGAPFPVAAASGDRGPWEA